MPEILKVCGITSVADARFAADQGATALGFIFFTGSPRYIRPPQAALIAACVPPEVLRVGLFINESAETIRRVAAAVRLNVVQLHGDEAPEVCAELQDLRIWKGIRINESSDLSRLPAYSCEAFLLDTDAKDGSFGGTGRTFPWGKAVEAKGYGRVVVAGGLDGENVADLIRHVDPWGVDACSKLENQPGVKDPEKVRRYLDAAKSVK
ncbi:MAG: phosphoribosylanthranilate isomerase [Bryobacterales bacterium]